MKPIIFNITNIAPLYRAKLWETLLVSKTFDLHYFFGQNNSLGIKTIDFEQNLFQENKYKLHRIKNYWIKGKYLIWQSNAIGSILFRKADMVILLGEFNIISNWVCAILCRICNKKVVFHGHGLYGSEKGIKLFLRKTFYSLANENIVYERRAKKIMVAMGFKPEKIHVMFNSLDYDTHKVLRTKYENLQKSEVLHFFTKPDTLTFIFVGRLTKVKKIDMVIEAIYELKKIGLQCNLLLIGDGTERDNLEKLAANLLIEGSFHFFGPCYDEDLLGKYLSVSDLCVSPGNVGLTAIHSLSFGTPVCTHRNFENQMPEVEALEDEKTGVFFEENNVSDLVVQLKKWAETTDTRKKEIGLLCYEIIDNYYNPHYQEKVIANLISNGKALV